MRNTTPIVFLLIAFAVLAADNPGNARKPADDADLKYWLQNMVGYHRFTDAEITEATGLTADEISAAKKKFDIRPESKPSRPADAPLLVMPYPGGRHPRIGFLDGAVHPQRETKISVFTPWDAESYVVLDVPEAIWSNLGLTYLAHTHVPTVWDQQKVTLEKLEWNRKADGSLDITRKLPNGIAFTVRVTPKRQAVHMEMTLTNGTNEKLSDLRVQMCAMLKGAKGFAAQTNDNKIFRSPFAAVKSDDGKKWVVFAFSPCHRPWGNAPCPCLHSDPKFPDLEPGQTGKLVGRLSFYEGDDIQGELDRIEKTGWEKD